jgi:hypothetical protein
MELSAMFSSALMSMARASEDFSGFEDIRWYEVIIDLLGDCGIAVSRDDNPGQS